MNRDPIQMTDINGDVNAIMESMSLDVDSGNIVNPYNHDQLYSEAVFAHGKETLAPVLEIITKLKTDLEDELQRHTDGYKRYQEQKKQDKKPKDKKHHHPSFRAFDPIKYWRNPAWKDLEDTLSKIFGLRTCMIQPYKERYSSIDDEFDTFDLNAFVYTYDRFPITGIITDKGLYDASHSIYLEMYISLGTLHLADPEEILGLILHEIGHNIDPALVNITFTEVNALSKYITDRENKLNKAERGVTTDKSSTHKLGEEYVIVGLIIGLVGLFYSIKNAFTWIRGKLFKKSEDKRREKARMERLKSIEDAMRKDKSEFKRQVYKEAFADNFARMYGYGPQLLRALKKLDIRIDERISRIKSEEQREIEITNMTLDAINDVHKTEIHRCYALIKEYDADLKDPNIPDPVKKGIKADRDELECVLKEYTQNFSRFQNRINQLILDELDKEHITNVSSKDDNDKTDHQDTSKHKDHKKK